MHSHFVNFWIPRFNDLKPKSYAVKIYLFIGVQGFRDIKLLLRDIEILLLNHYALEFTVYCCMGHFQWGFKAKVIGLTGKF